MKKAVFVTGGTVGSGYAIAERYGKEGYSVVITSRDGGRAGSAVERIAKTCGVSSYGYALDIRDEQRVKDIFADLDEKGVFVETVCLNSADMGFGKDPAVGMPFLMFRSKNFKEFLKRTSSGILPLCARRQSE